MTTRLSYKKKMRGVGLTEISIIKMCSFATVQRHKKQFNVIPGTKPARYFLDEKILNWYPDYEKGIFNKKNVIAIPTVREKRSV